MKLFKKITSAAVYVGIGILSLTAVCLTGPGVQVKADYVYDSTLSEKSKDPVSELDQPFKVFDIYDAYCDYAAATTTTVKTTTTTKKTTTTTVTTTKKTTAAPVTTKIQPVKRQGIDVSVWQGDIDWNKLKKSGNAEFAIVRAGHGFSSDCKDIRFDQNMKNAQAAGMNVGVYWYSEAYNVEQARQEAYLCLETIKGYSFNYPVYFDFENTNILNNYDYDASTLSAMISEFCSILESNGYFVGVYGSGYYLENRIYRQVLNRYAVWVAEYNTTAPKCYTGNYGMWQYSGSGSATGISGAVDRDTCYVDYPAIIGVNPKNGKLPTTTAQTTAKTTTATTTTYVARGYMIEDTTKVYDWAKFDKKTHKFAMLAVQGWQDFSDVKANIDAAHAAGIDVGILYVAEDANEVSVKDNAARLYKMLKTVKLEYPVYYWINRSDLSTYNISVAQHSKNIAAFCSYLEDKKYFVGIAGYDHELANDIDSSLFEKYSVWLFNERNTKIGYKGACGMVSEWDESIGGFAHFSKKNFPSIMSSNGLNGYTK